LVFQSYFCEVASWFTFPSVCYSGKTSFRIQKQPFLIWSEVRVASSVRILGPFLICRWIGGILNFTPILSFNSPTRRLSRMETFLNLLPDTLTQTAGWDMEEGIVAPVVWGSIEQGKFDGRRGIELG
jgi:hypothetical protein